MHALIADIGGTHTRCALAGPAGALLEIRTRPNAGLAGPEVVLESYLQSLPPALRPRRAVLAIAAPIQGDEVAMINLPWRFSGAALRTRLGLDSLQMHNDFAALARALPELGPADCLALGGGESVPAAPRVVLGPGTGLGVASLLPLPDGGWQAIAGEGGHVTLAAQDEVEERVIALARTRFGHCSAERLLSGPGLSLLHAALHGSIGLPAETIGARATSGESAARATLEAFFRLLGTVAANAALTLGARGGVYIGGGIVPRHAQAFLASGFRARFEDKGRYRDYLRAIPAWLITAREPTLTGLAAIARDRPTH